MKWHVMGTLLVVVALAAGCDSKSKKELDQQAARDAVHSRSGGYKLELDAKSQKEIAENEARKQRAREAAKAAAAEAQAAADAAAR